MHSLSTKLFRRILLSLFVLGLIAAFTIGIAPAQAESGSISYTSAWRWGDAIDTPGPGWEVTNNLGYRVQVEGGGVVFYSAELVACEDEHAATVWQRLGDLLGEMTGPTTAYAGHGDGESPAEVMPVLVESLSKPVTAELGIVQVSEPAWCQGHYLVARATEGAMAGRSLTVAGTVTGPDGAATPFAIDTALAWGTLADLQTPYANDTSTQLHGEIGSETLQIVVRRELDTLFDGVDFAEMDATAQAKAVLRNLTGGTAVLVVGGTVH